MSIGEVDLMKKGQAAMEFLMTYGWAILVVLAAIGALAYFGVLSPDRFLPDKCTATPPFSCTQYKITAANTQVTLLNNAGIDMSSVTLTLTNSTGICSVAAQPTAGILNGESFTWTTTNGCGAIASQRFKANYNVQYQKSGETVTHNSTGVLQVRAE